MSNLPTYLKSKEQQFQGKTKVLHKLLKKLEAVSHAPTTEKHTKRMLPFAQEEDLVAFVNEQLKAYFLQQKEFQPQNHSLAFYDIKGAWYLFTLLVYAEEVQSTVSFMWASMKNNQNADISLIRRIFTLCENPVYHNIQQEVEQYYGQLKPNTKVYQWLDFLKVTPPNTIDWNFTFRLQTLPNPAAPLVEKLFLTLRAHEPKGNGVSFELVLRDPNYKVDNTWDDFSTQNFIKLGSNKKPLSAVPQLDNLKEVLKAVEEIFELEFDKNYHFQYFSKGFKQKNNIQKWLLQA